MSIKDKISNILTPNQGIGCISGDKISQLQAIIPLPELLSYADSLDEKGKESIIDFIKGDDIIVFAGIIYCKSSPLNFKSRLAEIGAIYKKSIRDAIGDKKPLIDLYAKSSVEEMASLVEDQIIFGTRFDNRSKKNELVALRYLDEYDVKYDRKTYRFPHCLIVIAVHIETNSVDNPEVISLNKNVMYEHPFVYQTTEHFGQKVCLGDFYNSGSEKSIKILTITKQISGYIKQTIQILVTGYHSGVNPAGGHLSEDKYRKYIVREA